MGGVRKLFTDIKKPLGAGLILFKNNDFKIVC